MSAETNCPSKVWLADEEPEPTAPNVYSTWLSRQPACDVAAYYAERKWQDSGDEEPKSVRVRVKMSDDTVKVFNVVARLTPVFAAYEVEE